MTSQNNRNDKLDLATAFLELLSAPSAVESVGVTGLEAKLRGLYDAAASTWQPIQLREQDFLVALASKVSGRTELLSALESIDCAEIFLACACARGDEAAIRLFEERYFSVIRPALVRMGASDATIDDVKQILRDKLFTCEPGSAAKILGYAGQGELQGLVRVSAVRWTLHEFRKQKREVPLPEDVEHMTTAAGPEMQVLKAQHRIAFKTAFENALGQLSSQERNVLRLRHVRGISAERIADMYGVHRATATRWVGKIYEKVFNKTRRALSKTLAVEPSELDDVLSLVESQLELSIQRLLQSEVTGVDSQTTE